MTSSAWLYCLPPGRQILFRVWTKYRIEVSLLLEFYILATSKVISGRVLTCDSAYWCWLYSAAPLGYQATGIMVQCPTQSHYPDHQATNHFHILMLNAWLVSDKNTSRSSHWFDLTWIQTYELESHDMRKWEAAGWTHSAISSGLVWIEVSVLEISQWPSYRELITSVHNIQILKFKTSIWESIRIPVAFLET